MAEHRWSLTTEAVRAYSRVAVYECYVDRCSATKVVITSDDPADKTGMKRFTTEKVVEPASYGCQVAADSALEFTTDELSDLLMNLACVPSGALRTAADKIQAELTRRKLVSMLGTP